MKPLNRRVDALEEQSGFKRGGYYYTFAGGEDGAYDKVPAEIYAEHGFERHEADQAIHFITCFGIPGITPRFLNRFPIN